MAFDPVRTQALLHGIGGALHGEFISLRHGVFARDAGPVSRHARSGGRRAATGVAIDLEGHLSSQTVWNRVCSVWDGGGAGAVNGPGDRRLDHGHLLVALDLLHERTDGHTFAAASVPPGGRSRLPRRSDKEGARTSELRLRRNRRARAVPGGVAGGA